MKDLLNTGYSYSVIIKDFKHWGERYVLKAKFVKGTDPELYALKGIADDSNDFYKWQYIEVIEFFKMYEKHQVKNNWPDMNKNLL